MRSPPIPRSAMSFSSLGVINRPNGILPGAKVFQLPPPAVEAREVSPVGFGAGETATLALVMGGAAGAFAGGGDATATGERAGVAALATSIGVAEGAAFGAAATA